MNDIQFAYPWVLLLLLLLPAMAFLRGHRGKAPAIEYSGLSLFGDLGRVRKVQAGGWLSVLRYLVLASCIVAMARPQKVDSTTQVQESGIDLMLAIDLSPSMEALDYHKDGQDLSRVQVVRETVGKFIQARPNDRIGMVAFAGEAYLMSPLTLDHDWLFQNLDRVHIGQVEDGTAIGSAIADGINRLRDRSSKSKVLILLTDGDSNCGKISPPTAAEAAKALGIKLYAIGAGTNGMAPVPVFDEGTEKPKLDDNGQPVYEMEPVSFNEEGLKNVARIADGHFYRAADTESMTNIFQEIDKLEKSKMQYTKTREYSDLFPWFLTAGFALVAIEMVLGQTVWRRLP